jgi:hypothetical protein
MIKNAQVKEDVKTTTVKSQPPAVPFIFLGWVLCAVALVFIPLLFGALGLIVGYCVKTVFKRDMAGFVIMVMGVVCAIFGMIFGYYS